MGDARFGTTVTMATTQTAPRGRLTSALWILMWLTACFVAQQAADVERFSGTWFLIGCAARPSCFLVGGID